MKKTERYDPGFCVCYGSPDYCVCPPDERCLRHTCGLPEYVTMPPEVEEEWLDWIGSVEAWRREDYEGAPSCDIARACLSAMVDFCRDKGLL